MGPSTVRLSVSYTSLGEFSFDGEAYKYLISGTLSSPEVGTSASRQLSTRYPIMVHAPSGSSLSPLSVPPHWQRFQNSTKSDSQVCSTLVLSVSGTELMDCSLGRLCNSLYRCGYRDHCRRCPGPSNARARRGDRLWLCRCGPTDVHSGRLCRPHHFCLVLWDVGFCANVRMTIEPGSDRQWLTCSVLPK